MASQDLIGANWRNLLQNKGKNGFTGLRAIRDFRDRMVFDFNFSASLEAGAETIGQFKPALGKKSVPEMQFTFFIKLLELLTEEWKEQEKRQRKAAEKAQSHTQAEEFAFGGPAVMGQSAMDETVSETAVEPFLIFWENVFKSDDIGAEFVYEEGSPPPEVVGGRLFVFIDEAFDVDIGSLAVTLLQDVEQMHINVQNKRFKRKQDSSYETQILEHEGFKWLNSFMHHAVAIGNQYTGTSWFTMQGRKGNSPFIMADVKCKYQESSWEAHPLNLYTLERAVARHNALYPALKEPERSENRLQLDVANYRSADALPTFPIPGAVYALHYEDMQNATIRGKYLPHVQEMVLSKSKATVGFLQRHVQRAIFPDAVLDAMPEAERERYAKLYHYDPESTMSFGGKLGDDDPEMAAVYKDTHRELIEQGEALMAELPPVDDPTFREQREIKQREMSELYESRMIQPSVAGSDEFKSIVNFTRNEQRKGVFAGQLIIPSFGELFPAAHAFSNLSIFGDAVAKKMEELDNVIHVYTAHRPIMMLLNARHDAYRREAKLHMNIILAGAGCTSKSHSLNLASLMSIANTSCQYSDQTRQSGLVDGARNDQIKISEEMDPSLIAKPGSKAYDHEKVNRYKAVTENQMNTTNVFDQKEGSRVRGSRSAKSEHFHMTMGATNDYLENAQDALKQRLHIQPVDMCQRINLTLAQCIAALARHEKNPSYSKRKEQALLRGRQEQMIMCHCWKKIATGEMLAPEMCAFEIISAEFMRLLLESAPGIDPNKVRRDVKRWKMMAQSLTILDAIEKVFRIRGGAGFEKMQRGEAFSTKDIILMEPHMFCNKEKTLHAITLLQDAFIVPTEYKVRHQLQLLFKQQWQNKEGVWNRQEMFPEKITNSSIEQEASLDYDYVRWPQNSVDFAHRISSEITVAEGRPSQNNVLTILRRFQDDLMIDSVSYKQGGANNAPVLDNATKVNPMPLIKIERRTRNVLVHSSLVFQPNGCESGSVVKAVIKQMQYSCTTSGDYLLGTVYRDDTGVNHYERFDTISLQKTSNILTTVNANMKNESQCDRLAADEAERAERAQPTVSYKSNIDDWARMERHKSMGWSPERGQKDFDESARYRDMYLLQQRLRLDKEAFKDNRGFQMKGLQNYPSKAYLGCGKAKFSGAGASGAKRKKIV